MYHLNSLLTLTMYQTKMPVQKRCSGNYFYTLSGTKGTIDIIMDISVKGIILDKAQIENKTQEQLIWIHYFQLRTVLSTESFLQ